MAKKTESTILLHSQARRKASEMAEEAIRKGFHPVRAFSDALKWAKDIGKENKVDVPIIDFTIGNENFDLVPITEMKYRHLNEDLGVVPGTKLYKKIQKLRNDFEDSIPRGYRHPTGLIETRKAMHSHVLKWGLDRTVETSVFRAGASQGLLVALVAVKRFFGSRSVDLIFPLPGFTATMNEAIDVMSVDHVIKVQCTGKDFNLTPKDVINASKGKNPKVLVIAPTANPMGNIADPELLIKAVNKFNRISPDGVIILDWAYLMLNSPKNQKIRNLIKYFNSIKERCLDVISFSKATGDPGRRQCIIYGPSTKSKLYNDLVAVLGTINASTPRATEIEALAYSTLIKTKKMLELGELMNLRTKLLEKVLKKSGFFSYVIPPEGTLYVMAKFDEKAKISSQKDLFIQTGAATSDVKAFGIDESGWVRFSISNATSDKILEFGKLLKNI